MGKLRPLLKKLGTLCLVVVVLALATEVLFRVYPPSRPSYVQQQIDTLYTSYGYDPNWSTPDKELGFVGAPMRHRPVETTDYSFVSEGDRYGFANRGPWPAQADLIFLGDSLLVGNGVGIDHQFPTLVADALPGVSEINLGLPGAAPEHERRIYQRFGAALHPRLVIACLYVVSDIDNAAHFDAWLKAGQQWSFAEFRQTHYPEALAEIRSRPQGSREDGGTGSSDQHTSLRGVLKSAVHATALGNELLYLLQPWRERWLHRVEWPDGSELWLFNAFQKRLRQGFENDYPDIESVFFDPLEQLRAQVESNGATLVVALIPSKEEIFRVPGNDSLLKIATQVREQLDQRHFTVLDLYPAVERTGRKTAPYFPYDIHLNEAGNAAVAGAIVDWIKDKGLLDQRASGP